MESNKTRIILLIIGGLIFAGGLVLLNFMELPNIYYFVAFLAAYIVLGGPIVILALKRIFKGEFFDENFLMSLATIGAFIIGEYPEAVAVMLFFQVGEFFQEMAVDKSKKSITALMDIRPDFACLVKGKETEKVSPDAVMPGDLILVRPGEKIPLDGIVAEGQSMLDTRALTGESVPRSAKVSDMVLSGCINLNGLLTIKVTKTAGESTVAKIIDLVENASSKKAPTENFITSFSRYYTPAVVGLASLIAFLPPLLGYGAINEWVHRALVFLVISCPCALVISIPLGFFGGIGGASRKGVLVKGGNYLEALNKIDIMVFDKTGTLTKGVFDVTSINSVEPWTKEEVLEYAAMSEAFSNHPIAVSIQKAYNKEFSNKEIEKSELSSYNEISGQGVSVMAKGQEILAGNSHLLKDRGISFTENHDPGTKIYLAVDNIFIGSINISDELKSDTIATIAELSKFGIGKTVMLSGDNVHIAKAISDKVGLDESYGELLPHQKVEKVEMLNSLCRKGKKLAYVGDGINDAPVLARSDIGIAMGAFGSDAAIEAADVVIMSSGLGSIIDALKVARSTRRIVWQNIIFALGIKAVFLTLGAIGLASMWEAVFADVGVALLAILNASRLIRA